MTDRDKRVLLVASGDSRSSANQTCWETPKGVFHKKGRLKNSPHPVFGKVKIGG